MNAAMTRLSTPHRRDPSRMNAGEAMAAEVEQAGRSRRISPARMNELMTRLSAQPARKTGLSAQTDTANATARVPERTVDRKRIDALTVSNRRGGSAAAWGVYYEKTCAP